MALPPDPSKRILTDADITRDGALKDALAPAASAQAAAQASQAAAAQSAADAETALQAQFMTQDEGVAALVETEAGPLTKGALDAAYALKGEIPTGVVESPTVTRIIASQNPDEPLIAGDLLLVYEPPFQAFNPLTSLDGLTEQWVDGDWSVVADATATDGQALELLVVDGLNPRAISIDSVTEHAKADVEIVARVKINGASSSLGSGLALRGSGAAGTKSGYVVGLVTTPGGGPLLAISSYVGGVYGSLGTGSFTYAHSEWYWIRFRAIGDTIQARAWADGDTEPETWVVEASDDAIQGAGWAGLFGSTTRTQTYDCVGVAFDGDTAPRTA